MLARSAGVIAYPPLRRVVGLENTSPASRDVCWLYEQRRGDAFSVSECEHQHRHRPATAVTTPTGTPGLPPSRGWAARTAAGTAPVRPGHPDSAPRAASAPQRPRAILLPTARRCSTGLRPRVQPGR